MHSEITTDHGVVSHAMSPWASRSKPRCRACMIRRDVEPDSKDLCGRVPGDTASPPGISGSWALRGGFSVSGVYMLCSEAVRVSEQ